MRVLLSLFLILMLASCGSTKFVKFTPKPEIVTTPKLQQFLKENKVSKVVLRVPASANNATAEDGNDFIYNIIEKEFLKAGYIVRDRALFGEIVRSN